MLKQVVIERHIQTLWYTALLFKYCITHDDETDCYWETHLNIMLHRIALQVLHIRLEKLVFQLPLKHYEILNYSSGVTHDTDLFLLNDTFLHYDKFHCFFIFIFYFLFDTHNTCISHFIHHTQQPNTFRHDRVYKTWSWIWQWIQ